MIISNAMVCSTDRLVIEDDSDEHVMQEARSLMALAVVSGEVAGSVRAGAVGQSSDGPPLHRANSLGTRRLPRRTSPLARQVQPQGEGAVHSTVEQDSDQAG